MVGADVQHPAQRYQREVRIHIVLVQSIQCPLAQQIAPFDGRSQVADKLSAGFRFIPLAQSLHSFPVSVMQCGEGVGGTAHADAAALAQNTGCLLYTSRCV